MDSFDANKTLPQSIALKSAENHLFRIGLSFESRNDEIRGFFHKPLLISIIIIIAIIKFFVSLLIPEENVKYFIYIGDFTYFLGIRGYYNIAGILYGILALNSQLIYYYNYKNDIKPTFLKVFEMMSGLVSPKSIGLTNKEQIYKLVKIIENIIHYHRNQ